MLSIYVFDVRFVGKSIWIFDIEAEDLQSAKIKLEYQIQQAKYNQDDCLLTKLERITKPTSYWVHCDDKSQELFNKFLITV